MSGLRAWRLGWILWLAGHAFAQQPGQAPDQTSGRKPIPGPPGAAVERAAELLRAGRAEAARDLLLEIVATAPRHAGARMLLGRIELELGELESARRHLEVGVGADPPRPYLAWHLLGRVRLLQGEAGPALAAWDRALELAPRFVPARLGRAGASLRLGALGPAASDLERALALAPRHAEAALLLAELRLFEDRLEEARPLLSRVAGSPEAGPDDRLAAELLTLASAPTPDLAALRGAAGRHPRLARGLLALGLALHRTGNPAPAEDAFRAALATDEEDPMPWLFAGRLGEGSPPPYPRPLPALGPQLERAGRLAEDGDPAAVEILEAILERRPHHLAARLLLTRAAELGADSTGDGPWRALDGYLRLLDSFPAVPAIETAAARTARAMGALELAECLAARAARALPLDARARYLLAVIQAEAGRHDEAVDSCRRAIALGLEEAPVYLTLGLAELRRMNVGEAIASYSRALELDPQAAGSIPPLALAALTTEEFGALRELLRRQLEEEPDHRQALYSLGAMSLRENDLAAARSHFERLEVLTPDDPQVHYNLGVVHLRLGNSERGAAAMARFRQLESIEAQRWLEHNRAHALRLEARAAADGDEPEKAIEIYRRLAAAGIADRDDYLAAGRASLALGDLRRAHGWFAGLLEAAPYHRDGLLGLAAAAEGLGRTDEARRARARAELLSWECDAG